jgi:hypothetical protein
VAVGELGVGPLGPTVSHPHGPEELLLDLVCFLLIKLLIRLSQGCEREGDLVNRLGNAVEQLLPRVGGRVRHRLLAPDRASGFRRPRLCGNAS